MVNIQEITERHFEEAAQNAYNLLGKLPDALLYHRKEHTTDHVVPSALDIARVEGLTATRRWLVGVMAAFHDAGFTKTYVGHELAGADIATEHMRTSNLGYTEKHIQIARAGIINTNNVGNPPSKEAAILRDADLSILGDRNFIEWNDALRKEALAYKESDIHENARDDDAWAKTQLAFLAQLHRWFTKSAANLFAQQKTLNIKAFKDKYGLT